MTIYKIIINIHIFFSSVFVVLAFYITARSIFRYFAAKPYLKLDNIISRIYLFLLYIGLFFGIVLYFFVDSKSKFQNLSIEEAIKYSNLRFWAIEHFATMTFALILSQIGYLMISKSKQDRGKYASMMFYFGISSLLTVSSVFLYLISK